MLILAGLLMVIRAHTASGHDVSQAAAAVAARMRVSTERVLAALPPAAREQMVRPFDDRDRVDWHYTPRSRNGVALKALDTRGRDAVHALLKDALSAAGYGKVVNIIELDLVLREARALLDSLSDAQRREAVFDSRTFGDIVTANADKVDPLSPVGIAASQLCWEPALAWLDTRRDARSGAGSTRLGDSTR